MLVPNIEACHALVPLARGRDSVTIGRVSFNGDPKDDACGLRDSQGSSITLIIEGPGHFVYGSADADAAALAAEFTARPSHYCKGPVWLASASDGLLADLCNGRDGPAGQWGQDIVFVYDHKLVFMTTSTPVTADNASLAGSLASEAEVVIDRTLAAASARG